MKQNKYKSNILNVLDFIYECGKGENTVIYSSISNLPLTTTPHFLYYPDGKRFMCTSFKHLLKMIYSYGKEQGELDLEKTKDFLRNTETFKRHLSKECIVPYYGVEVLTEDNTMELTLTYSDCVKAKAELNAVDFKKWVETQVVHYGIDYVVNHEMGVNKMMKELKEIL